MIIFVKNTAYSKTNHEMKTRLVSKKLLGHVFGLATRGGTIHYKTLRESYFTDEALTHLGITKERYTSIKGKSTFNFAESEKIIQYFGITSDELRVVPAD